MCLLGGLGLASAYGTNRVLFIINMNIYILYVSIYKPLFEKFYFKRVTTQGDGAFYRIIKVRRTHPIWSPYA